MAMPGIVIKIGANTRDAIQGINQVQGRLGRFQRTSQDTMRRAGKSAALGLGAGIAAGVAAAGALAVKGIQSAIEDEASQSKLAAALQNTTGATADQVAAMEDYISAAQEKTGLDDGEMRTGLSRLLRSTKDTTRAQAMMNTAMEISLATGKPLGAVVEALAKYNDGNAGALKRLGITQGEATRNYGEYMTAVKNVKKAEDDAARARETYGPKSDEYAKAQEKVHDAVQKVNKIKGQGGIKWIKELNTQFEGSIAADADTYAGSMRRVSTAFDELLEAFGAGAIGQGGGVNGKMDDLASTMYDMQPDAEAMGAMFADIAFSLGQAAQYIGPVVAKLNELNDMGDGILTNGSLVTAAKAISLITGGEDARTLAAIESMGGVVNGPRDPSAGTTSPAAMAASWARNPANPAFYGSGGIPRAMDPARWKNRAEDADGRAKAQGVKTRANPAAT